MNAELPVGDHQIVLLQLERVEVEDDVEPLVFHRSAFRQLSA